jgi:hypothetical protein
MSSSELLLERAALGALPRLGRGKPTEQMQDRRVPAIDELVLGLVVLA